jgi:hypothetical protein
MTETLLEMRPHNWGIFTWLWIFVVSPLIAITMVVDIVLLACFLGWDHKAEAFVTIDALALWIVVVWMLLR